MVNDSIHQIVYVNYLSTSRLNIFRFAVWKWVTTTESWKLAAGV